MALALVCLLGAADEAHGFLIDAGGKRVVKIADFPDTPYFQTVEGDCFDAGVIYKQWRLLYVPLWIYDVRWCGFIEDPDYHVKLSTVEISQFTREAGWSCRPRHRSRSWTSGVAG